MMTVSASETEMFCGSFLCFLARLYMLTTALNKFFHVANLKNLSHSKLGYSVVFGHVTLCFLPLCPLQLQQEEILVICSQYLPYMLGPGVRS